MQHRLNLGVRGHDMPCNTPEELANILGKIGASHVQLALKKSFPDLVTSPAALTPAFGHAIRTALEAKNCRVSVLGCYIDTVHPDPAVRHENLDWFKANLRFAKYLGADMVGTETGALSDLEKTYSEENFQVLLSSVRELTDFAEKIGSIVAIEPVWGGTLYSPELAQRLLGEINSPCLRLIYDPVNLANSADIDDQHQLMDRMYRCCGDAIILLHLKDFVMENGAKHCRLASDGVLDYDYLFDLVLKYTPYIDGILEEASDLAFPDTAEKIRRRWEAAAAKNA